jgi:hypothetical protein
MRRALIPEVTENPHHKLVAPFTPDEVSAIDDVRFSMRHQSRTQPIRFLIQKGLGAVAVESGLSRPAAANEGE